MSSQLSKTNVASRELARHLSYFHFLIPLKHSKFDFIPGESFRHFYFRFSNKVPSSHSDTHQCFCRYHYCPFHD
jgi:hypothetical protein